MNNYYRADLFIKTVLGPAVPGAQIYVCLQPANIFPPATPPRTIPIPWQGPNPQASIFSDNGFTPIVQPIIADGFGAVYFYALPGRYTYVVVYGGRVQTYYIDQTLGNAGSAPVSTLLLSTNGTPNFNQTALNFVQGSGITLAADNLGNVTISGSSITYPGNASLFLNGTGVFSALPSGLTLQTNGTYNGSQTLQNLVNGSGITVTQDGAGNVTVTNTSPAVPQKYWQTFGYKIFVENTSGTINAIGTVITGEADVSASNYVGPTTTDPAYKTQETGAAGTTFSTILTEGTAALSAAVKTGVPSSNIVLFSTCVKLNTITNMRYYTGFSLPIGVSLQSAYVTDTPNTGYIMFRYSSTADGTTWHGVVGTDNSHQTSVNTGVAVNTSAPQDLVFTYNGTTLSFSVDGSTPVTITTNIPAGPLRLTSSIDNHNIATSCIASWSYWLYSVK
jgi:hypothetical protein